MSIHFLPSKPDLATAMAPKLTSVSSEPWLTDLESSCWDTILGSGAAWATRRTGAGAADLCSFWLKGKVLRRYLLAR